jgi:hypothetical protein
MTRPNAHTMLLFILMAPGVLSAHPVGARNSAALLAGYTPWVKSPKSTQTSENGSMVGQNPGNR